MNLNEEQHKAAKTINRNVIVSAGAGTGKTRVLVKRYIEILKNGQLEKGKEIESILAITFTKKAAREMKSRVIKELIDNFPKKELHRYMEDIERANISTIHSFCTDVLRENPVEANLDPNFLLLEDLESEELINLSIDQVLLREENLKMKELSTLLEVGSYQRLKNIFYNIYMEIRNGEISYSEIEENLISELEKLELKKEDLIDIKKNIKKMMEKSRKNAKIKRLETDKLWIKFNSGEMKDIKGIVKAVNYFEDFLGNAKALEKERQIIKEKIISINKVMERENYPYYLFILDILKTIDLTYRDKKKEIHVLDFNDLEEMTLKLLKNNGDIRKKYINKFKYIMVDEFQDTNKTQQEIIYLLSSKEKPLDRNNLFVVGDPKQSIYRFRGADLQVFYNTEEDIINHGEGIKIELKENYRNDKKILNFVNYAFKELMGSKYSDLSGNVEKGKEQKIRVLDDRNIDIFKDSDIDNICNIEAIQIVYEIKKMIDKGYKYKDIAILFRSSNDIHIYESVLKEYGIPFYNNSSRDLLDQREILDLINGIKAVSNLNDNISNIGFLKSPMIGLSDNYIYWIFKEKGNIKEKIISLINNNNLEELGLEYDVLRNIILLYESLQSSFINLNIIDFIDELIKETNYMRYLIYRDKGYQGVENIKLFKRILEGYKHNNEFKSNIEMIVIMEKLKSNNLGQKNINSETSNVVEIMTIHKAKGLEFPVVIVPQLGKTLRKPKNPINFNKNLGIGINIENRNGKYKEIENENKLLEEEEEKRVLYVALTRAEEYLVLGNYGNSSYKKMLEKFIKDEYCQLIEAKKSNISNEIKSENSNISLKKLKDKYLRLNEIKKETIYNIESSITQYLTYKDCPRKYYFKYRLNLDLENEYEEKEDFKFLNPLDRGSILHKFIESYDGNNLNETLQRVSSFYGYKYENIKKELNPYIQNFIVDKNNLKKGLGYDELGFKKKINGVVFKGYIDRINILEDGIEIIDYKSDNVTNLPKIEKSYEEQIQFYTIVGEEIFNKNVNEAKIYLLETGEYLNIDIREEKLNKLKKNLNDFAEKIKKHDKFKSYNSVKICSDNCEYIYLCRKFERKY